MVELCSLHSCCVFPDRGAVPWGWAAFCLLQMSPCNDGHRSQPLPRATLQSGSGVNGMLKESLRGVIFPSADMTAAANG